MFKQYAKVIIGVVAIAVLATTFVYYTQKPKRYAVFAGYNADGTIHPYVISYLKGLNEVTDGVVYIADSTLKPEEEEKLKGLTIHYENVRHEEYDWGSYKRGFNWLKDNGYLDKADELIFANDSCYAPMTSFKPMFEAMAKRKDLDFWGDLQNSEIQPHIQSYFMVFRKKVIQSAEFDVFLNFITKQSNRQAYVDKYETQLTSYLANLGYRWDSYMPYKDMALLLDFNKTNYPLTLVKKYDNQFIKKRVFAGSLALYERIDRLLWYLKTVYPERYAEIAFEFPPEMVLNDLKNQTIFAAHILSVSDYGR